MATKKELVDNHHNIYDTSYDDSNRYDELIKELYDDMHAFIDEQYISVLSRDRIGDFTKFMLDKVNRHTADEYNKEQIKKQVLDDWRGTEFTGLASNAPDSTEEEDHTELPGVVISEFDE